MIKANIGDAHAMGNKPITFIRQVMAMLMMMMMMMMIMMVIMMGVQVMALMTHPPLLEAAGSVFPEDVRRRAVELLGGCRGGSVGSYSDSPGIEIIRCSSKLQSATCINM